LNQPLGVAVDATNNVFVADAGNSRVRKISGGIINTVAGGGSSQGDGGPAINAGFSVQGIAVDRTGNLVIADFMSSRIRMVSNGIINTIAGTGEAGFSGDGGAATSAKMVSPSSVAFDVSGNILVADNGNFRIRELTPTCAPLATLTAPAIGKALSGSTATFTWVPSCSNASAYWLDVGTASGQGNIFGQNVGLATTKTVSGIPANGSTIYVQLWTQSGGTWFGPNRYTYTAAPN
jgi:hypothetical protein